MCFHSCIKEKGKREKTIPAKSKNLVTSGRLTVKVKKYYADESISGRVAGEKKGAPGSSCSICLLGWYFSASVFLDVFKVFEACTFNVDGGGELGEILGLHPA